MYYRVAIHHNTSPAWEWKSTSISSLTALFQFLRRYDKMAQDKLRVFSSPCLKEMDEQLARENNGFGSCSVTAAQFRQEHMMSEKGVASYESSNGIYAARENHPLSSAVTSGVASQMVSRGDFWNLMSLANS